MCMIRNRRSETPSTWLTEYLANGLGSNCFSILGATAQRRMSAGEAGQEPWQNLADMLFEQWRKARN